MPEPFAAQIFTDAGEGRRGACRTSTTATPNSCAIRLRRSPQAATNNKRYRAFYPEVGVTTTSVRPGRLAAGSTAICRRPAISRPPSPGPTFSNAISSNSFGLIMRNHGVPVTVSESTTPIPLHFAFLEGSHVDGAAAERIRRPIRDLFDVPDLDGTDDQIANGTFEVAFGEPGHWRRSRRNASTIRCTGCRTTRRPVPSISRISCCSPITSSTSTNSVAHAHELMAKGGGGYVEFVEPGNVVTQAGQSAAAALAWRRHACRRCRPII